MIKRYNNISFLAGVPGILMQFGGRAWQMALVQNAQNMDPSELSLQVGLSQLITLIGVVLLIVGLAYYAKAKARSPWWGLFGLLSCIGIIILACLKDHDTGSCSYGQPITYLAPTDDQQNQE